jgi:hypothetical protein
MVLLGNDEGVADIAAELKALHISNVLCNDHGTPMVSDAFAKVRSVSDSPVLSYVNTDIILLNDFTKAARYALESGFANWMIAGQRHDLDICKPLDFSDGWENDIKNDVLVHGQLHGKSGMDYFIFPKDIPIVLPPFAVGRPGWDSWMIYQARSLAIPVVDAVEVITAIHQNHPPAYRSNGVEACRNKISAGGVYRMGTLRDADWRFRQDKAGNISITRNWSGRILFSPPIRALLAAKRWALSR